MRICVLEDTRVVDLEPITLTRPAFSLRCGAQTILERQRRILQARETSAWVRPRLVTLARIHNEGIAVNKPIWFRSGHEGLVYTNSRWLPAEGTHIDTTEPHVGLIGEEVAYVVPAVQEAIPENTEDWLESWSDRLPHRKATGLLVHYLWEAVDANADFLLSDEGWFRSQHPQQPLPASVSVVGPSERFLVAENVTIEPSVVIDTRKGPVMIDRGVQVQANSRIEGPCYIGPQSWIMSGARLRGGTIGPSCRVGGEVEASILQGFSNKYHDGFLGHSYLGTWVNLAAGTQTSDIRNDYGEIRVQVNGQRVATGRTKVGSFIGDHSKTGLGVLLNTGSNIGIFANLLPSGSLLPHVVPSFCRLHAGVLTELWDSRKLFTTADTVMKRRGIELRAPMIDLYHEIYEETSEARRTAVHESDLRHSV